MKHRKFVTAALAAGILVGPLALGASATNKPDRCPGQHIQVWNESSNVAVAHYVCAGDIKGQKGDTGPQGPKGDKGDTGATGPAGPAGTNGSDGATGPAGATGSPGPAGETGAPGAPGVGLPGPQGTPGPQGPAGSDGAPGATGPAGADSTVPGPVGPQGPAGADGSNGTPGSDGKPGNDGAPGATGESGPAGVDGQSAWILSERFEGYPQLCTSGNGTVFAYGIGESLGENTSYAVVCDGTNGVNGTDGKSAYDIAVENGFVGSVTDWLDSLQGAQGEEGIEGPQGPKGTPGTVTVVHEDGTQSEVPIEELPKTGANNEQTGWIAAGAAATLLVGAAGVTWARRRDNDA